MTLLSDVFKYTQALGQRGHQIGRKVGDAIEVLTLGMVHRNSQLAGFMRIEDALEGASQAKHKVEFSFYQKTSTGAPSELIDDLFGFVECKKVGVEQTVTPSFKEWLKANRRSFHATGGYTFRLAPQHKRWSAQIEIASKLVADRHHAHIKVVKIDHVANRRHLVERDILAEVGRMVYFAVDVSGELHCLFPPSTLRDIATAIDSCTILHIETVGASGIEAIDVQHCLAGPQTPEKAKQASFVALDVRKRVLGSFDKQPGAPRMTAILVIAEASHWEDKSRNMIRLCNDINLEVPDDVVVDFFESMHGAFGDAHQDLITKSAYRERADIRDLVEALIVRRNCRVLRLLGTDEFVQFDLSTISGAPQIGVAAVPAQRSAQPATAQVRRRT